MCSKTFFSTRKKAFTLIELLVVIAIIGILFVVLVSKVDFATNKAKTIGVQTDFRSYQVALQAVGFEQQGYTDDFDLLASQLNKNLDPDLKVSVSEDQIITDAKDPWGTAYKIAYSKTENDRGSVIITSAGPDLQFYTDDDIATIVTYLVGPNGAQIVIDAMGDGYCVHRFCEWNTTTEMDCTHDEVRSRTCTECGHIETIVTTTVGHQFENGLCTVCGEEEVVPGLYASGTDYASDSLLISWDQLIAEGVITVVDGVLSTNYVNLNDNSSSDTLVGDLYLPESAGITTLSWSAFGACQQLTRVHLPNSLTTIEGSAFVQCTALQSVNIPASVTSIGSAIFYLDYAIEDIEVDPANTYCHMTDTHCFVITESKKLYRGFTDSIIPADGSVTSIANHAFSGCKFINFSIPDNVTFIDAYAFLSCTLLETIDLGNGLTSINSGAFMSCTSLDNVIIPSSLTSLPASLFSGCSSLTTVSLPNTLVSIGSRTFGETKIKNVVLPESLQSIGSKAFLSCYTFGILSYAGTQEQWEAISKSNDWHSGMTGSSGFTVACSDGNIYVARY